MHKSSLFWLVVLGTTLISRDAMSTPAPADAAPPPTNAAPTVAGATNAIAIPLGEIAAQGESASATLQTIAADASADKATEFVRQDLPMLMEEISARLEENSKVLSRSPSLELLARLGAEWQDTRVELAGWKRGLVRRVTQLDGDIAHLSQLAKTWDMTRESNKTNMPPEVSQKVEAVIAGIKQARENIEAQQTLILTLQSRVAEQDTRVSQSITAIEHAREEIVGHLFVKDAVPIWSSELWSNNAANLARQSQHSFSRQLTALGSYAQRKQERFLLHGVLFLALFSIVLWARRKLQRQRDEDSDLKRATLVFEVPIATALVLSLFAGGWIYPQAPRLLSAILGAAALIPAVILLRRVLSPPLLPVLNLLVTFYFVDQLRSVVAAPELLSRTLFLAEMLTGIVFLVWLLRRRFVAADKAANHWRAIFRSVTWCALFLFSVAFLANALGYESFSRLLGKATLTSAYLGLVLYAVIRIVDGIVLSALNIPPLSRLEMVRSHRPILRNRTRQVLEWTALCLWAFYTLEAFSLRANLFQDLNQILIARLKVGSISLSLGEILLFAFSIWTASMVSRVSRFVLEEEVYPHVQLAPGLHYSISRMVHYAILVAGFTIGIAMLGFDMTKLTILAGAVGVGLGFGLQNIINNFVSGIILLFERPVKVGDIIQLDTTEGIITHIGIRASVIRTSNGPEIIVPNGKLISDPVTNWTFSRRQRLIIIPVSIVPGVDAGRVLSVLSSAAAAKSEIMREPPAQALLVSFAGGALNFELRVWTNQINDWMQIRSDLSSAINSALIAQNVSIK